MDKRDDEGKMADNMYQTDDFRNFDFCVSRINVAWQPRSKSGSSWRKECKRHFDSFFFIWPTVGDFTSLLLPKTNSDDEKIDGERANYFQIKAHKGHVRPSTMNEWRNRLHIQGVFALTPLLTGTIEAIRLTRSVGDANSTDRSNNNGGENNGENYHGHLKIRESAFLRLDDRAKRRQLKCDLTQSRFTSVKTRSIARDKWMQSSFIQIWFYTATLCDNTMEKKRYKRSNRKMNLRFDFFSPTVLFSPPKQLTFDGWNFICYLGVFAFHPTDWRSILIEFEKGLKCVAAIACFILCGVDRPTELKTARGKRNSQPFVVIQKGLSAGVDVSSPTVQRFIDLIVQKTFFFNSVVFALDPIRQLRYINFCYKAVLMIPSRRFFHSLSDRDVREGIFLVAAGRSCIFNPLNGSFHLTKKQVYDQFLPSMARTMTNGR